MKIGLLVLVGVTALIGILAAVIFMYSDESPASCAATLASVLILAATAVVVVFYTDETRRMASATMKMADATLAMAKQQCSANVLPRFVPKPVGPGRATHELVNEGAGTAFDVVVRSDFWPDSLRWPRIEGGGTRQLMPPTPNDLEITYQDHSGEHRVSWHFTPQTHWKALELHEANSDG